MYGSRRSTGEWKCGLGSDVTYGKWVLEKGPDNQYTAASIAKNNTKVQCSSLCTVDLSRYRLSTYRTLYAQHLASFKSTCATAKNEYLAYLRKRWKVTLTDPMENAKLLANKFQTVKRKGHGCPAEGCTYCLGVANRGTRFKEKMGFQTWMDDGCWNTTGKGPASFEAPWRICDRRDVLMKKGTTNDNLGQPGHLPVRAPTKKSPVCSSDDQTKTYLQSLSSKITDAEKQVHDLEDPKGAITDCMAEKSTRLHSVIKSAVCSR